MTPSLEHIGVGEASWCFKNTFSVTEKELSSCNLDLVFEGIDTYAVIELVSPRPLLDAIYLLSML